jgi:phosphohistidine phosphatase
MPQLILLRHAKSAWPEGVEDFARPLAPRGRQAAELIGKFMAERGILPIKTLVSPAKRTTETAQIVASHVALDGFRFEPSIYEARYETLLGLIHACAPLESPLMLIGHNPGIAELANRLADPDISEPDALERLRMKVPTAALIVLETDGAHFASFTPGSARLMRYITPKRIGGVDED